MRQFDTQKTEFENGDYLVVPDLVHRQVILPEQWQALKKVQDFKIDSGPTTWVRTMSVRPLGGYYAYSFQRFQGPPWRLSTEPLDTFSIFVVIAPDNDH